MYGGEKPVPIWLEDTDTDRSAPVKRILFSLTIKMRVSFMCRDKLENFNEEDEN